MRRIGSDWLGEYDHYVAADLARYLKLKRGIYICCCAANQGWSLDHDETLRKTASHVQDQVKKTEYEI